MKEVFLGEGFHSSNVNKVQRYLFINMTTKLAVSIAETKSKNATLMASAGTVQFKETFGVEASENVI